MLFTKLGAYTDTVHLKDYHLKNWFVVHISETFRGTDMMDWDTRLNLAQVNQPNGWLMIEHLPDSAIAHAKQNPTLRLKAAGLT